MKAMNVTKLAATCLLFISFLQLGFSQPAIDGRINAADAALYGSAFKTYWTATVRGSLYMYDDDTDIYFAWKTTRSFNDNVYSTNSNDVKYAGWSKHSFGDLLRSDHLVFKMKNNLSVFVLDVDLDYLFEQSGVYKSGLATGSGAHQYDGRSGTGASHVTAHKTSLEYDIYTAGWANWATKSPPYPEADYWVYEIIYEFKVSKAVFGANTFGDADVLDSHNSPAKDSGVPTLVIDDGIVMCQNINENMTYTLEVKNIGTQNMTNTVLVLTYDPYHTFVSSSPSPSVGNYQWNIGTLIPNQTFTLTVTCLVGNSPNDTIQLSGEVTASSSSGTVKISALEKTSNCQPFPVELVSFTSNTIGKAVQLKWRTATEVNNFGFEVQRSTEEKNWNALAFVAGHGTSNTPNDYSYTDATAAMTGSTVSYRLKQIDRDGSFEYSPIVQARFNARKNFGISSAFPNPFNPSTVINYTVPETMPITLKVYNALGEEIQTLASMQLHSAGNHSMLFDARDLSSGTYFIHLIATGYSSVYPVVLSR